MNPDLVDTLPMDIDAEFWQDSQPRDFEMEICDPDPVPLEAVPAADAAPLLPEDPILHRGDMASCDVSAGDKEETTPEAVATVPEPHGHPEKRKSKA